MATIAEHEQDGFWEELEKHFDRQIPIKNEVRYSIDTVFKCLDVFDPEERAGVIDTAVHIAYEIATAAFRGEDAEEVQREVADYMSERDIHEARRKAVKGGSQLSLRAAIEHGVKGDDSTPGKLLEMFEGAKKLPNKYEQERR